MDRTYRILIPIFLLMIFLPASVESQQRKSLVQRRLMADMRELKNKLNQLNQTVKRLEKLVAQLRRRNQKNRKRILTLERELDRTNYPDRATNQRTNPEPRRTSQSATNEPRQQKTNPGGEWIESPDHPYTIRRNPLDHKVIYVTTDDTTLTKLAHRYYRDASYWRAIYQFNRDKLPSPDVIPPGLNLVLPPIANIQ